jgi:flagellar L-ring protein precursor FlgH
MSGRAGILAAGVALLAVLAAGHAGAANLYSPKGWSAMASDQRAERVGDTLTVVIDQSSLASNTAQNGYKKDTQLGGQITAGTSFNKQGQIDVNGGFTGTGQTGRSDKIVAQITVVVDAVLPNGDLRIEGVQALKINGERTNIHLKGRVRPADIAADNSVLSTRVADAAIDYDGNGLVSKGSQGGIVERIFSALHLP